MVPRLAVGLLLLVTLPGCLTYEYEHEFWLRVDGSGTVNVTGRPALWTAFKALGDPEDPDGTATKEAVRELFERSGLEVGGELDAGVVTVGAFQAGYKHNIIPDEAHLQITVRSYKDEVREQLEALGHTLGASDGGFGGYQAIMLDAAQGVYYGASEVRKDGQAAGY